MNNKHDIELFIETVRKTLPRSSEHADGLMHQRGFNKDDSCHLWIETFADVTNILIAARNRKEVTKHFSFFSRQYLEGSEEIKNCIDVSYVENLFFDLPDEDKKWAWKLLSEDLKKVYVGMWGKQSD